LSKLNQLQFDSNFDSDSENTPIRSDKLNSFLPSIQGNFEQAEVRNKNVYGISSNTPRLETKKQLFDNKNKNKNKIRFHAKSPCLFNCKGIQK